MTLKMAMALEAELEKHIPVQTNSEYPWGTIF